MAIDDIQTLVQTRQIFQELRIGFSNRISAIESGRSEASESHTLVLRQWLERFTNLEEYANADITEATKDVPIIERMIEVKGVGRIFGAQLISMIDIEKASTVSSLWKYCGYAVDEEGRADRRRRGQKISYNPKAKTLCWNIGSSFLRANSPYRNLYDNAREKYEKAHPDWTKAHVHNAALRIMIKRFLSHLWLVWRELEGLSTRVPYVHEYMGHTSIDRPEDYGW